MLQIYKASAGSGKTFTLAYEFIKLIISVPCVTDDHLPADGSSTDAPRRLNHPDFMPGGRTRSNLHRHVLAITFTNKATGEMKQRIVDELAALAHIPAPDEEDTKYAEKFIGSLGCTRAQLAETAAEALHQLLCDYHYFHVGTIDSFFQRVLRTFARELDRPGDFNIELDDKDVVRTSVGMLIDDFNIDPDRVPNLDSWIYNYLLRNIDSGSKTNFFNRSSQLHRNLVELVSHICDEEFKPYIDTMRKYLEACREAKPDENPLKILDKALDTALEKSLKKLQRMAEATKTALGANYEGLNGNSGIKKHFENYFLNGELPPKDDWYGGKIVSQLFNDCAIDDIKSVFKKGVPATDSDYEHLSELYKFAVDLTARRIDTATIHKALNQLELLGYTWRYIDQFAVDNNTVLLSDTNHLISRIIGRDETPFIYERMAIDLRHFLIDEFQDTSKLQWANLRPLVANSMAERHYNLIIGDEKQSIYRFRNSDSSLLRHQVGNVDFPAPRFSTVIRGMKPEENTNHRSSREVVQFNNALFARLSADWQIAGYEKVVQEISRRDVSGYVHFVPFAKSAEDQEDSKETDDITTAMIKALVGNLDRQHSEGGYRWADMAVLVDTNKHGAQVIEYIVNERPDIPVVSDEALYLRKSSAVRRIVDMLKLFAYETTPHRRPSESGNRYPSPAEATIIISRYEYYTGTGLSHKEAIDRAIADYDSSEGGEARKAVETIRSHHPATLAALVEIIVHMCVSPEERQSQYAYIAAFQDYVVDYSSRGNASTKAFLDAWESDKSHLSVAASGDIDAVTVLTIHKSKGLEFPCVHIPFGSWDEQKSYAKHWVPFPEIEGLDKKLCPPAIFVDLNASSGAEASLFHDVYQKSLAESREDCLNKTYVGYTRAERELIVYYQPEVKIGQSLVKAFSAPSTGIVRNADGEPNTIALAEYFNAESGEFILGEPTHKSRESSDESREEVTLDKKKKPAKKTPAKQRADSYKVYVERASDVLTRFTDMLDSAPDIAPEDTDEVSDKYIDEEARLRGIILHDIFSLTVTRDDLDRAVDTIAARNRIPQADIAELRGIVSAMLDSDDPRILRWFGGEGRVYTEQTVYSPLVDKDKRLDRLVTYPDGSADIIDYKFTGDTDPEHRRQVNVYRSLIADMGFSPVRTYLWYPLLDKIIEVK